MSQQKLSGMGKYGEGGGLGRSVRHGFMEIHMQEAGSDRHHLLCDSDGSIRGVPSGTRGSHNENGGSRYDPRRCGPFDLNDGS